MLTVEGDGRTLEVADFQPAAPGSFVRLLEVQSREAAATLVGRYLTVSRSATPTASDPISWDEVIGITVRTPAGEVIGEIIEKEEGMLLTDIFGMTIDMAEMKRGFDHFAG